MGGKAPRIQAVIFDLDDTLYPERDYVRSGYRAVGAHLREATGGDERFEDWLWRRFLSGEASGAFDALNGHFSLQMSAERISELVSVYRSHKPDIRPYEAVPDLLERLHGSHQLGLLSDGFLPAQRLKLDALEIERFFDAVVFTEEIARDVWKPSPVGFEAIREKLGVEHQGCAYVADNPAKDFVAPNQLGWLTVQYLQPGQVHSHKPPPDGGAPQVSVDCPDRLYEALFARD